MSERRRVRPWHFGVLLLCLGAGCDGVAVMDDAGVMNDAGVTRDSGSLPDVGPIGDVRILTLDGGRIDWSAANGRVAFDRRGSDGVFDIYTMAPDGTNTVCLTCDVPGLPRTNRGQPASHPNGRHLVMQVAKPDLDPSLAFLSNPGAGRLTA